MEEQQKTMDENTAALERKVVVINKMGVHARPATKLVETAAAFPCDIVLVKDGEEIDAKSIFGVMTMAALQGAEITIRVSGDRAPEALEALEKLFTEGFGELEEDRQREAGCAGGTSG